MRLLLQCQEVLKLKNLLLYILFILFTYNTVVEQIHDYLCAF